MSVILDALKKLEQEKKVRAAGPVRLSPDLLVREDAPRRKKSGILLASVLCLAIGAGGVATWILKRDAKPVQVATAPRAEMTPAAAPAEAPAPAPIPAQVAIKADAAPAEKATVKPMTENEPSVAAAPAPRLDPSSRQLRRTRRSITERPATMPESQPSASPEARPKEQPAMAAAAPSDLAVSGIAWQDNRGDRRAVVNGGLYREGATVAGTKIVQIMQDRVRFSRDGRTFEVQLSTPFVR